MSERLSADRFEHRRRCLGALARWLFSCRSIVATGRQLEGKGRKDCFTLTDFILSLAGTRGTK